MPTYSYRCTECDNAFDIHQSFSDDTLTECPACGGRLRKVFSPVGVTFNGSGFYRTDSRATSRADAGSSSGSSSGSPSGSKDGARSGGDSKPAAAGASAAPAAPQKTASSPATGGSASSS